MLLEDQYVVLQKQSPILEDMNYFIDLAKQMGLINKSFFNYLPNATACKNANDIYESHIGNNRRVIVQLNDIYGMLALLGLGVAGSLITFPAENLWSVRG